MNVAGGVRGRDLSAVDRGLPIPRCLRSFGVRCRVGWMYGGRVLGDRSNVRVGRCARVAVIPRRPGHGTGGREYSDCAVESRGGPQRGCWRPGVHWDVAREPSGCSASWLSCCSWPHQVGEGNRGCATPWGHRYSCDSWDFASLVHQIRGAHRRRHAVVGSSPLTRCFQGKSRSFSHNAGNWGRVPQVSAKSRSSRGVGRARRGTPSPIR